MKKVIFLFGGIIGVILCINLVVTINIMYSNTDFKGNAVVGYAAMVLLFSLIYFGIRNYRNNFLGGSISFLNAFKTGALIALIASTIYVVVWLFYYYLFVPDFIDVYTSHVLNNTVDSEVQAKTEEMANFKEMYKNPFFVILITYFEVLPIGLAVAFLSSLLVMKKK